MSCAVSFVRKTIISITVCVNSSLVNGRTPAVRQHFENIDMATFPQCLILTLLMLAGDVQVNPGPVKYPCSFCLQPVCKGQRALLCDECDQWSHACCSSVSMERYQHFQQLHEFDWMCSRCLMKDLPFADCSTLHSGVLDPGVLCLPLSSSVTGTTVNT